MLITDKDKNGLTILKKCFSFFSIFPIALFFSIAMIVLNMTLFGSALYIEYHHYGISIFDFQTLWYLLEIDLWGHFLKIGIFLCLLIISGFITTFCSVAITYNIMHRLNKKRYGIWRSLIFILKNIHLILHTSLIVTISYAQNILDVILVAGMVDRILSYVQGKRRRSSNTLNTPEGALFFPLLIDTDFNIPEIIKKSHDMITAEFGQHLYYNVSFQSIKLGTACIVSLTFGVFIHYHFDLFAAIIISLSLIFSLYSLIESMILLFQVSIYNHIKGLPTGPFNKKDFTLYFKK